MSSCVDWLPSEGGQYGRRGHGAVEDPLDGTMRGTHRGQPLRYHAITARPVRVMAPTPPAATPMR
jgi:hypothetical protein